jgi:hypothetical protein
MATPGVGLARTTRTPGIATNFLFAIALEMPALVLTGSILPHDKARRGERDAFA